MAIDIFQFNGSPNWIIREVSSASVDLILCFSCIVQYNLYNDNCFLNMDK